MIPPFDDATIERFSHAVSALLGLRLEARHRGDLARALQARLDANGLADLQGWLSRLSDPRFRQAEVDDLAARLTVGETYFFRNAQHFAALRENVLPDLVEQAKRSGRRTLRALSAGCSTGAEAGSLAIVMLDALGGSAGWQVDVQAVDVNPRVLEAGRAGRYSAWALREAPAALRRRYFHPVGREYELIEDVRNRVQFRQLNFAEADAMPWPTDHFDLVFCRNMVMYLTPAHLQRTIDRVSEVLRPDGYLFLGHAESLRGVQQDFVLQHTHETFYYRLRSDRVRAAPVQQAAAPDPLDAPPAASPFAPVPAALDPSWMEVIQASSQRIADLATSAERQRHRPPAPAPVATSTRSTFVALDLMRSERFDAALDALPEAQGDDLDIRVLRAVLLTNKGATDQAEAECRTILAADGLHAGAHYLLALCEEQRGQPGAAREHDERACHLDPAFAMPRLHLGLMARREGALEAAREALEEARRLLHAEDAARVLMFGGGFSREALVRLCEAELRRCGAAS